MTRIEKDTSEPIVFHDLPRNDRFDVFDDPRLKAYVFLK